MYASIFIYSVTFEVNYKDISEVFMGYKAVKYRPKLIGDECCL